MFSEDEDVELEEDRATLAGIDLVVPLVFLFVGCPSVIESLRSRRLPNDLAEGTTGAEASSVRLGVVGATEAARGP